MISKTGLHAVLALTALAKLPEGTYEGAASIAEKIGAPANYLGKLLKAMTQEGLVISQKGLGGGFRLAKPARKICILDVVEPIEHVSRWTGCYLTQGNCSDKSPCAVHDQWQKVRRSYLRFLEDTTIADLAVSKGK